jgi:hypothetical protein
VVYEGQSSRGPVIKAAKDLTIWDKIKTRAGWAGSGRESYTIPATGCPAKLPLCLHCGVKRATRARGLCWGCYYLPGVKERYPKATPRPGHPEVTVSAADLAGFFGWYVAEGCPRFVRHKSGYGYGVIISQNPGAKRDRICSLLDRLPWKYHTSRVGVVIANEQAYRLVCDLGDKYTKRVPQWIKDAPRAVIAEFLRCAVDGDGWRQRAGEAYATVSPLLADDIQELYLKVGFGASVRRRKAAAYCIRGRAGDNCVDQYHVHRNGNRWGCLRDSANRPNFRRVPYDGMVYCAAVPNGTLIVRRNGKVAVCGNCLVLAAVAASLAGLQWSAAGQPAAPQAPRRRTVSLAELQRARKAAAR